MFYIPPLFIFLIALVVGIIVQQMSTTITSILAILSIFPLLSFYVKKSTILLIAIGIFAGSFIYFYQRYEFDKTYQKLHHTSFDIIATVTAKTNKGLILTTHTLIDSLSRKMLPIKANVMFYTNKCNNAHIDDTIFIPNAQFHTNYKDTFKKFLIKENIVATIFDNHVAYFLITRPRHSFARWINTLKNNLKEAIQSKMQQSAFTLFAALFLGYKSYNHTYYAIANKFKKFGIAHYLARSGLHLVIVIFLLLWLVNLIPMPLLFKELLLLACILLYTALSWQSISFIRALLCFLIGKIFLLTQQPSCSLTILSLSCLLIIINNPIQIFFIDFQLSFILSFALALFGLAKHTTK